jgi:hypothetical protein
LEPFLGWIEGSALGHFMRESGPWTYAIVNLIHITGIGALFRAVLILDLRLLGIWRHLPTSALADTAGPVSAAGFTVAAAAGVALLSANATEYIGNPFLLIKFPAIGIGVLNALAVRSSTAWRSQWTRPPSPREERQLRVMGGLSLACWITAIAAGRMIGYW